MTDSFSDFECNGSWLRHDHVTNLKPLHWEQELHAASSGGYEHLDDSDPVIGVFADMRDDSPLPTFEREPPISPVSPSVSTSSSSSSAIDSPWRRVSYDAIQSAALLRDDADAPLNEQAKALMEDMHTYTEIEMHTFMHALQLLVRKVNPSDAPLVSVRQGIRNYIHYVLSNLLEPLATSPLPATFEGKVQEKHKQTQRNERVWLQIKRDREKLAAIADAELKAITKRNTTISQRMVQKSVYLSKHPMPNKRGLTQIERSEASSSVEPKPNKKSKLTRRK